ncbi:MAG: ABC transporter permease subunit [Pseudomonadota bacterium]
MIRSVWVIAALVLAFVFPVIVLVLNAFSSSWPFPEMVPPVFDLRAMKYLAQHGHDIGLSLLSSCLYSFGTILLTFCMTILPAKLFARTDFSGKNFLEGLFLAPALIPSMTFAMGAHFIFLRLGIADTVGGVILILSTISYPYMLRALTAGYQAYGEDFAHCAKNLGASPLRILLAVELPLLLPALLAGATIVFLVAFSEYFLVFLIGGGTVPSFSGYIFPILNSSDKSVASALTLIFLVLPIAFFFIIDRIIYRAYRKRGML